MFQTTIFYLSLSVSSLFGVKGQSNSDPTEIQTFLDNYNSQAQAVLSKYGEAAWNYNTNITDYNQKILLDEQLVSAKFSQEAYRNATRFNLTVMGPEVRRLFIKIMDIGTAAQTNETKLSYLNKVQSDMMTIYSTAKITMPSGQQLPLDPALCDEAGYRGPLHRCDIYNSTAAGTLLSNMLKLGASKPWPEAMYLLTGQNKMDAQPLMDYFKPLLEYLRQENGNDYGWHPICPTFAPTTTPKPNVNKNSSASQNSIFLSPIVLILLLTKTLM